MNTRNKPSHNFRPLIMAVVFVVMLWALSGLSIITLYDETTMRTIAQIGEGEFFRASNVEALHQVFGLIDQYEKAKIKETRYTETTDYYTVYLS